jgi:hypothetical protein
MVCERIAPPDLYRTCWRWPIRFIPNACLVLMDFVTTWTREKVRKAEGGIEIMKDFRIIIMNL